AHARAILTAIVFGTPIPIAAFTRDILVLATVRRIARVIGARVVVVAVDTAAAGALASLAGIVDGAGLVVVARCIVRQVHLAALTHAVVSTAAGDTRVRLVVAGHLAGVARHALALLTHRVRGARAPVIARGVVFHRDVLAGAVAA